MFSYRAGRAVAVSLLALVSCRQPSAPAAPPTPAPTPSAPPRVLDALGAGDRAWAYVDGQQLREAVLPDLLQAVGAQRADLQVGLATLSAKCGFQPLLAIDELFARIWWEESERASAWAAVLRMQQPLERNLACLRAFAPEARETSLDGRRAWLLQGGFVAWSDGLFIVASSALQAHAMIERMARPESAALQARAALAGVLLAASVREPDPFGMALDVRWVMQRPGSRLELRSRFKGATSATRAETILRDSLLQMLGSSASLDPAIQGVAERLVHGVTVSRDGPKLDVNLDMPRLAGQTATVSRLTTLAVRGVRLYTAWDLMGEAREAVYVIADALVAYAVRTHGLGHPARFPPSAPLVPEDIPYGKRVVPNPHAFSHPSWQDIHFSSDRPTFYACDFVTSKDGKSVVVRARGDIDGDGTTSLFELDVRLDAQQVPTIAPMIRERDPEE
jgi:hypothetical protein